MTIPWYVYPLLLTPRRIAANLERVHAAGLVPETPNLWQLAQGVLRMYHRLLFRSETVGTCAAHPVRRTWRARLLQYRPLRFPALLLEGAVKPLDLTGLASSPDALIRHLLGAHHDGLQFVFDLQLLSVHPGKLDELASATRDLLARDDDRARWLKDLTVYERYHETLLAEVERALAAGGPEVTPELDDPDLTFTAYLAWCAAQPATPQASLRAWRGRLPRLEEALA